MKKGFTLIEMFILIAIISIVAAITIPYFIAYQKKSQDVNGKPILLETPMGSQLTPTLKG